MMTPVHDIWPGVAAGAGIALASTLPTGLVVRRLPSVIKSRDFLRLMVICEGMKWLLTAVMTGWLLSYFSALGMVVGFAVTYFGSYLGCFLIK